MKLKQLLGSVVFLIPSMIMAQEKASPAATATGTVAGATITINYSSPAVKGRKIYGTDLVPYGKAWRAGANEATTIETSKDITVEGKALKAGKYSFFVIAGEKEWTIVLNSQVGQWGIKRSGEANYDPANNVLTATVKPVKSATMNERLVYVITANGFVLKWENLEMPVGIK